MTSTRVDVTVELGPNSDALAVDGAVRDLRTELLDLEVRSVALAGDSGPDSRVKGVDLVEVGGLVVELFAAGALGQLVDAIRLWLDRDRHRSVTLTIGDRSISVTGASREQTDQLIDALRTAAPADG